MNRFLKLAPFILGASLSLPAQAGPLSLLYKLNADDGLASDQFGYSVAIDGTTIAVGALTQSQTGSVYVFDASTGLQTNKLVGSDSNAQDQFGQSVAVDGNSIAVGARRHDSLGADTGAVYVFDATTGTETFKLTSTSANTFDFFGHSVALEGDVLAVGSLNDDAQTLNAGAVHIFDVNTGTATQVITAGDGATGDQFGHAVDIDDGLLVVGARLDDDVTTNSGSAYIFDVDSGTQLNKLSTSDPSTNGYFGYDVAIEDNNIVVGAVTEDAPLNDSGAAYQFDTSGPQIRKLIPSESSASDLFGFTLATSAKYTAIGAVRGEGGAPDSGTVFLYDNITGLELDKIDLSGLGLVNSSDQLGFSVDLTDDLLVVGARLDDSLATNAGAAYVFSIASASVPAPAMIWLFALGLLLTLTGRQKN